jgi:tungstate transport system substrate-binding protein
MTVQTLYIRVVFAIGLALLLIQPARAEVRSIVVASTTSTQDSGLFNYLLPLFTAKTGITVKVLAQGTGQAIDTARRGDADVLFVHAKAQEQKFVADGFGVQRFDVMYNDFVLVGPKSDPAGIKGRTNILTSFKAIHQTQSLFITRGDRSGTHTAELALWAAAELSPATTKPLWFKDVGQGMGAALNMAATMGTYVLADRGTWAAFRNKQDLEIAVAGDPRLFNQYGAILVNPSKQSSVRINDGQAFIDWLTSAEGQSAIGAYKINGEQLFIPNAVKSGQ